MRARRPDGCALEHSLDVQVLFALGLHVGVSVVCALVAQVFTMAAEQLCNSVVQNARCHEQQCGITAITWC